MSTEKKATKSTRATAKLWIEAPAPVLAGIENAAEISGIPARTLRQEIAARLRSALEVAATTINPQAMATELMQRRLRKLKTANGAGEASE